MPKRRRHRATGLEGSTPPDVPRPQSAAGQPAPTRLGLQQARLAGHAEFTWLVESSGHFLPALADLVRQWQVGTPGERDDLTGVAAASLRLGDADGRRRRHVQLLSATRDVLDRGQWEFLAALIDRVGIDHARHDHIWASTLLRAAEQRLFRGDAEAADILADAAWCAATMDPRRKWAATLAAGAVSLSVGLLHSRGATDVGLIDSMERRVQATRGILEELERQSAPEPLSTDLIHIHVRLALSMAKIPEVRRRAGVIGWTTSSTAEFTILMAEVDWLAERAGGEVSSLSDALVAAARWASIMPKITRTLTRLFLRLTAAASHTGRRDAVEQCRALSLGLAESGQHRVDMLFQIHHTTANLRDQSQLLEEIVRAVDGGELDQSKPVRRDAVARRFKHAATNTRKAMYLNNQNLTGEFWGWKSPRVVARLAGRPLPSPRPGGQRSDETAESVGERYVRRLVAGTDTHPPASPVGSQELVRQAIRALRRALQDENPVSAAINLVLLAGTDEDLWDLESAALIELVERSTAWLETIPRPTTAPSDPPAIRIADADRMSFRVSCLNLAGWVARLWRPDLEASIHLNLAMTPGLTADERRQHARKAISAAHASGRPGEELKAHRLLLALVLASDDQGQVPTIVNDMTASFARHLDEAHPGVELIELIALGHRMLMPAVRLLAERGHVLQAFAVVRAGTGWLPRAMTHHPHLVDDYDAFQSRFSDVNDAHRRQRFMTHMERRIIHPIEPIHVPLARLTNIHVRPGTALVQFVRSAGALVALVALVEADDATATPRYASATLGIDDEAVRELAELTWLELRPSRGAERSSHRGLTELYQEVIAPIMPLIAGASEIVFHHEPLAGLPLHAALNDGRYLIQDFAIRYSAGNLEDARPDDSEVLDRSEGSSIIGGWDASIGAGAEVDAVSAVLGGHGFRLMPTAEASAGRAALLDPDASHTIVHVAAHGTFVPWPRASSSTLSLTDEVILTANDWMRTGCQAQFVFLNACSVGNGAPARGDLSGFPLALKVRGARGSLTALGDIPSAEAQDFALRFYRSLDRLDSFAAYVEAVRGSIAAGLRPSAWVPYVYEGQSIGLTSATARENAKTFVEEPTMTPPVSS